MIMKISVPISDRSEKTLCYNMYVCLVPPISSPVLLYSNLYLRLLSLEGLRKRKKEIDNTPMEKLHMYPRISYYWICCLRQLFISVPIILLKYMVFFS